jgi:hypothetical protein
MADVLTESERAEVDGNRGKKSVEALIAAIDRVCVLVRDMRLAQEREKPPPDDVEVAEIRARHLRRVANGMSRQPESECADMVRLFAAYDGLRVVAIHK